MFCYIALIKLANFKHTSSKFRVADLYSTKVSGILGFLNFNSGSLEYLNSDTEFQGFEIQMREFYYTLDLWGSKIQIREF